MKKGNFIWFVVLLIFISGTLMAIQSSEEIYLEKLKYKTEHEFSKGENLSDVNNNENLRDYCDSFWTNTTDDWITNVTFNTINNNSGQEGANSYADYTAISTDVTAGATYTFSMTWESTIWVEKGAVWFDWNQDDDFFDAGEYYEVGEGASVTVSIDITIPNDATPGATRMRVSERYNSYPEPCNEAGSIYGETEDYTVIIGGGATPGTIEGTVYLDGGVGNVEDVEVEAGGVIVNPAADGTYSIERYPGTYDVTATLAGYEDAIVYDVVVEEDLITSGIDLTLIVIPQDPIENLAVDSDTGLLTWDPPVSGDDSFSDDFEAGVFTEGWELVQGSSNFWEISDAYAFEGVFGAAVIWGYTIDTWLITPEIAVGADHVVSFAWEGSYYWSVDPNDNCDLFIQVSTDGGSSWDPIWTFGDIGVWENWIWYETSLDLSAYAGETVMIGFNVVGDDNGDTAIDNIYVGPAVDRTIGTYPVSEPAIAAIDAKEVQRSAIIETRERDLLGYNVYLGGILQGYTTDLEYLLTGLVNGVEYTAGIEAVYDEGVSNIIEITFIYTGASDAGDVIVTATKLNGNYPNPFNPVTTIAYSTKDVGNVTLEVYNLRGQLVKTLVNEVKETGEHTAIWDGTDDANKSVSSGVYFYKMVSEGNIGRYTSTKKMILMK